MFEVVKNSTIPEKERYVLWYLFPLTDNAVKSTFLHNYIDGSYNLKNRIIRITFKNPENISSYNMNKKHIIDYQFDNINGIDVVHYYFFIPEIYMNLVKQMHDGNWSNISNQEFEMVLKKSNATWNAKVSQIDEDGNPITVSTSNLYMIFLGRTESAKNRFYEYLQNELMVDVSRKDVEDMEILEPLSSFHDNNLSLESILKN